MSFEVSDHRTLEDAPPPVAEVEATPPGVALCFCGRPANHRGRHTTRSTVDVQQAQNAQSVIKRASPGWSQEDQAMMAVAATAILLTSTLYLEQRSKIAGLAMRPEEAQALGTPTTRIVLRHVRIKRALQGDAADVVLIGTALFGYSMRVLAEWQRSLSINDRNGNGTVNGSNGGDWTAAYRIGPDFAAKDDRSS